MRILVAPDKFEGTLTAVEVCDAMTAGWHDQHAADEVTVAPMADGGPGFVAAMSGAPGATLHVVHTIGPHGDPVQVQVVVCGTEVSTAYIESASCCGLALAPLPRRPLEASSRGLVALIEASVALGAERIVIGVGGTASTDGGRAVVEALEEGQLPRGVDLVVATDVDHPLLGPAGAARSFGPQKGASPADVEALEQRLAGWASSGELDPATPGAGAGGGLGYGLMRLGAQRVSGAAVVADAVGLDALVAASDLVITGEGAIDFSSLRGKVVAFVAARVQASARPCVAVAGRSSVGRRAAAAAGIDEIYTLEDIAGPVEALAHPGASVRRAAGVVARDWSRR